MKLAGLILFSAAICAVGAETAPLKTFKNAAYGFELDYPAGFAVKESKGVKGGYLRRISFYADPADEEPCFMVDVRPLEALRVDIKTRGIYRYYPKEREWRLEPEYEAESLSRLRVSYLTGKKIPVYSSLHSMANAYRDDVILTDRGYALVLRYSDATRATGIRELNDRIAASFRLIGVKALAVRIIEPPSADE